MTLIIFDLNRTLYDPDTDSLVSGALETLSACAGRGYSLALLSRDEPGRTDILEAFGIGRFFNQMCFVSEKTPEIISSIMAAFAAEAHETYIVGDYPPSEIRAGNAAGVHTIRLRAGKFGLLTAHGIDEANHEITELRTVLDLVP